MHSNQIADGQIVALRRPCGQSYVSMSILSLACRSAGRNVLPRHRDPPRPAGNAPLLQRGAHLAAKIDMFETSSANLIGGFVFGSIGFVAFIYGKRMNLWKIMLCGLALMIFPYFIADAVILCAIGAFGTAALLFLRE